MRIDNIILKPILTEKGSQMLKDNVYPFEVNIKANKSQIAVFLEQLYKVKVGKVRIMTRIGKIKRVGKKMKGKKAADKKFAYVKLISGKIDIFPQA